MFELTIRRICGIMINSLSFAANPAHSNHNFFYSLASLTKFCYIYKNDHFLLSQVASDKYSGNTSSVQI